MYKPSDQQIFPIPEQVSNQKLVEQACTTQPAQVVFATAMPVPHQPIQQQILQPIYQQNAHPDPPPYYPGALNYQDIDPGIPEDKMERFRHVVEKFGISMLFAMRLRELDGYEIVIICDDSGSMSLPVSKPNDPFIKVETRWQEAQRSIKIIVDVASIFDPDGIDVYYLNRLPILNVTKSEQLDLYPNFYQAPSGSTPLGETINKVLNAKRQCERNLLLIVFTDGEPNNMDLFKQSLKHRNPVDKIFVSLVACTDDDNAVGYLNGLDKLIPNTDTNDDYYSELKEIKRVQGPNFTFTFGDYICKILLGAVCPYFDKLDEEKLSNSQIAKLKTKSDQVDKKRKDSCILC